MPRALTHAAYITDLLDRVERGEVANAFTKMLEDLEPELYSQAIQCPGGNPTKAAELLGVTRLKMREKLKQVRPSFRQAAIRLIAVEDFFAPEAKKRHPPVAIC